MFHEKIRQATRPAHLRLERQIAGDLKNIRSYQDYGAILDKFHSYFKALEAIIQPHITPELLPDMVQRRPSWRLKEDLESIGYITHSTTAPALPIAGNALQAFGLLYVMEGSTLGGSIIVKMLQERCAIHKGLSFFEGYGEQTMVMWQKFRDCMDHLVTNEREEQEIIRAANDTFDKFSILFQQHEQTPELR